jgi:hypothetical protein
MLAAIDRFPARLVHDAADEREVQLGLISHRFLLFSEYSDY